LPAQGNQAAGSRRLLFCRTLKSHDRVKPLVTVAGGFPAIVRPLTRRRGVWIMFNA
jgi:hypothetical protein